jgi:hypothetical protein
MSFLYIEQTVTALSQHVKRAQRASTVVPGLI